MTLVYVHVKLESVIKKGERVMIIEINTEELSDFDLFVLTELVKRHGTKKSNVVSFKKVETPQEDNVVEEVSNVVVEKETVSNVVEEQEVVEQEQEQEVVEDEDDVEEEVVTEEETTENSFEDVKDEQAQKIESARDVALLMKEYFDVIGVKEGLKANVTVDDLGTILELVKDSKTKAEQFEKITEFIGGK